MKTLIHCFSFRLKNAAAVVTLSLLGFATQASQPPAVSQIQPAPAAQPAANSPVAPQEDILDIRGPIHIPGSLPVGGLGRGRIDRNGSRSRRLEAAPPPEAQAAVRTRDRKTRRHSPASWMAKTPSHSRSQFRKSSVASSSNACPVRAAHRTTNEFLHDLVNLPDSPLAAHRETLADFLHHCDLAKFARWSLTVPEMEAMLDSASAFVIAIGKPKSAKKQPKHPPQYPPLRPLQPTPNSTHRHDPFPLSILPLAARPAAAARALARKAGAGGRREILQRRHRPSGGPRDAQPRRQMGCAA